MEKDLIYKRLGQNIQHLRKTTGLTQNELAERISRTEDSISNLERGLSAPPPETASAIAQALGCELTDLYDFDWSGKPIPNDLKDFLRELRTNIANMPSSKRNELYEIIQRIILLIAKN